MRYSLAVNILRKWTTPVHFILGMSCCFLSYAFGLGFGLLMLVLFAGDEVWNDICMKDREGTVYKLEGDMDWWECYLFYMIGVCILALLQTLGVISPLRWW